ncbi:MAG: hypothetical protein B6245_02575 [Desulfobacteraceae bacterium 4572_88]|nr:MAG: hypothetical protein B6245_02575 [Desulfobacteraceae bacterium 4572_88]
MKLNRSKLVFLFSLFIIHYSLFITIGCGSKGGNDTAQTEGGVGPAANIILTASDYALTVNGKDQITVTVAVEDSQKNALTGERILFTVINIPTSEQGIPYAEYTEWRSETASGIATTTLSAPEIFFSAFKQLPPEERKLTVRAEAENGTSSTLDISLRLGSIGLTYAGGGQITAIVTDANNDPVEGEDVVFTVPSGNGSFDNFYNDPWRVWVTTGTDGRAKVTYIPPEAASGTVPITAWAGGNNLQTPFGALESVGYPPATMELDLTSDPSGISALSLSASLTSLPADGVSSTFITATIKDEAGGPISNGTDVIFSTTMGKFPNGENVYSVKVANDSGSVTVPLTAGTISGTAEITCYVRGVTHRQTIEITSTVPPSVISLSTNPASIVADGTSATVITAIIKDDVGNAVLAGTPVTFSTTLGRFPNGSTSWSTTTPDITGAVTATLFAGQTPGTAEVTCFAGGGVTQTITVTLTNEGSETPPITITMSTPSPVPADGVSSTSIKAEIKDSLGNPVRQGMPVNFTATLGKFPNGQKTYDVTTPDETGAVTVSLIAETTPGIGDVTCSSGGITQKVTAEFTGEISASKITLNAYPVNIQADGVSSTKITALIKNDVGQAVSAGTPVTFSTTKGAFPNGSTSYSVSTPDNTGAVSVGLTAGQIAADDVVVNCFSGSASGEITVTFTGTGGDISPATITLQAGDANPLMPDGASSKEITATITDGLGSPVREGTPVYFSTTLGSLTTYATTTRDETGKVIFSLIAGYSSGTAEVTCRAGDVSQKIYIQISGQAAATISMTPSPGTVTIPADGTSSTSVLALIRESSGASVIQGTRVEFTTTLGRFENNSNFYSTTTPDETGSVTISLISSTAPGIAEITCESGNISQKTTVEFTRVPETAAASLSLSLSQISVKSDNSDSAVISATVLDANNAVVEGVRVAFSADGGQLRAFNADGSAADPSSVTTAANGKAEISFSSGTKDKTNRTVTITASIEGLESKSVPVKVVGSTVGVTTESVILVIGENDKTTLTITVNDAGTNPAHSVPVDVSVEPENALSWVTAEGYVSDAEGRPITDVTGKVQLEVTAKQAAAEAIIRAEALGAKQTQTYSVGSVTEMFGIIEPTENPAVLFTGESLTVTVRAPSQQSVIFSTSFGTWSANGEKILSVPVVNDRASALLSSGEAGVATVQVIDPNDSSTSAILQVVISAKQSEGKQISLQTSAAVLEPSSGDIVNSTTLSAVVRVAGTDQVVPNVPVAFSLSGTTGGGEFLSPVLAYTDNAGMAKTVFTSGASASGSQGVTITAVVMDNSNVSDSLSIVIGQTPGSVVIGRSTLLEIATDADGNPDNTAYRLPMSVLVADANGNPVSGAKVSLAAWPKSYATGYWTSKPCVAVWTGIFPNEDKNRNLIMEANEDANNDGKLTPHNSATGTLAPESVTTDENGIANFDLTYLKKSAVWIDAEITATALVFGSEAQSTYTFTLPYLETDACFLPHSPYNVEVGAPSADRTTAVAEPANLTANGISTSTIYAEVADANGNTVSDGEPITFEITSGGGRLSSKTASTYSGIASVTYTSSSTPGNAVVAIKSSDGTWLGNVTISLTDAVVGSVTVSPVSGNIVADGVTQTQIRASVMDSSGYVVRDGTPVTFRTSAGTFFTSTGNTVNGIATAMLTSPANVGTATVTATSGGVSDNITVTFVAGPVSSSGIRITATPANLSAGGSQTSVIEAEVTDANGNPVANERITFSVVSGRISPASAITDEYGVATTTYTPPGTVPGGGTSGTDTIRATSTNGTSDTLLIGIVSAQIGTVSVHASNSSVAADGVSITQITATVTDSNGNPVVSGTEVNFSSTAGTLSSMSAQAVNGTASVTLTSPRNLGIATLSASVGGVSNSTQVTFVAGPTASVNVTANPASLIVGEQSSIEVVVLDANNNRVNGETLTFVADDGSLATGTSVSNPDGEASNAYTAPGSVPAAGIVTITVQSTDGVTGTAVIPVTGPDIAKIELSAVPPSLPADGKSIARINAVVTMASGAAAPDGTPVYFGILRNGSGSLDRDMSETAGGTASVRLTSGSTPETIKLRAGTEKSGDEIRGVITDLDISYTPGSITLSVTPNSILGTGNATAKVTAVLKDVNGALLGAGTSVTFTSDDPAMGDFLTDQNQGVDTFTSLSKESGEAFATFRGAANGGTVAITATWMTDGMAVTASETLTIQAPPLFIDMAEGYPDPTSINIKGTGGQATSQVVFEVKDTQGNPVADGYRINFTIFSGPDGGEMLSPPFAITSTPADADGNPDPSKAGQVSTVLTSGFRSGPVSIRATYHNNTSVSTATGQIAIAAGPPVGEAFGIYPQYVNISGLWKFGLANEVTVDAADFWGNSIPDNTAISFKTYNTGGLFDPGSSQTDGGFAKSTLYSVPDPVPAQGFVSITAEAVNGGRSTRVNALAVVPETEHNQILYAGTNGGGVYKSTNSGASWTNISRSSTIQGQNWIDPYVNDVAVDPDNSSAVYAATGYQGGGNLYRSLDGGLNWNSNNMEEWSGVFSTDAAVLSVLCDDDGSDTGNDDRHVWVGSNGMGAYFSSDGKHFQWGGIVSPITPTEESGPGEYSNPDQADGDYYMTQPVISNTAKSEEWTVTYLGDSLWEVKGDVSGIQTLQAVTNESYTSDNGEISFTLVEKTPASGGGYRLNFDVRVSGLGYGTYVSDIVKVNGTHGASAVLYAATGSGVFRSADGGQTWEKTGPFTGGAVTTLELHGGSFSITGTVSGRQTDYDITTGTYTIPNVLSFTILDDTGSSGIGGFEVGDTFTFNTTRDPGRNIRSLLADQGNNLLYAVTLGELSSHSVGNIYVHELNPDGSIAPGDWREANTGLPQYDPPDDTTLFAQHVIAPNIPGNPTALYIGGEGINFYKATSGLDTGELIWQESKNGLSNLIMARMPVLFSGLCESNMYQEDSGFVSLYIQDKNGNPPVAGTKVIVRKTDSEGKESTLMNYTYPDTLTHTGTWRDPSDSTTNNPYRFYLGLGDGISLEMEWACSDAVPGCSSGD